MKLYGTLSQLVAAIFRKDNNNITLRPNQSVTYNNDRDVQLPEENANSVLVSKTSPDVLTNKSISGATNTLSNIPNNATTAVSANTPSTIVARDGSGNFSAGTITASLSGNASTATSATSATSFTGSLSGEVTGTQSATIVADDVIDNANIKSTAAIAYSKLALTGSILNADLAGSIADSKLATISTAGKVSNSATTATSSNTASAIVARDASGNFSAGTVSATGANVSGLTASSAVVTDASKNLASLAYTSAGTGSTIMSRDVAGSTSVNTLSAANIDVTGLATMDKAYIDGSTGNGFIEFEGQQVADIAAPTTGEARLFAGTDGKIYVRKAGSSQAEELGAGGSGEINLVDNSSDAGSWGVVNATATTNTTAANNPLSGTIDTSIAIASSTSGGYARYRFTMPSALKQRKLKLEWYQIAASLASGAYRVEVYTNAASDYSGAYTELSLSTDSAGNSNIPNLNGKYSTTFDTNGSDYYEIRIVRTAASAATIYIANVVCGPGIQPQGAVVGEWTNYTATVQNLPTSTVSTRWRRVGASMEVEGFIVASGAATGSILVNIPSGYTVDSTKLGTTAANRQTVLGEALANNGTTNYPAIIGMDYNFSTVGLIFNSASTTSIWNASTPFTWANTNWFSFQARVPIAEWAGSGTVQLAQNDVEYAYNKSTSTTASDTTSFDYGPSGAVVQRITACLTRTVQFQTPIQNTDILTVEILASSTNNWVPVDNWGGVSYKYTIQNGTTYGLGLDSTTGNQAVVRFGQYAYNAAGFGAVGTPWSTAGGTFRWRVRKSSAGAAVGFGIVQPGTSAGLVSASGLPGNTTGNAVASGYVGEQRRTTYTGITITGAATQLAVFTNVTPGTYLVRFAGDSVLGSTTRILYSLNTTVALDSAQSGETFWDAASAPSGATALVCQGMRYLSVTATIANYYLVAIASTASSTGARGIFELIRIA